MHTFKDANGKVWTVTVDVDAIKTIKSLVGVNLCELHEGSPPLVERLEGDLILLCDVLFAVLKEQADAVGIDEKESCMLDLRGSPVTSEAGPAQAALDLAS